MRTVYLDNAATTPLEPRVIEAMKEAMENHFGNPSSVHHLGRSSRVRIVEARKKMADLLNCSPSEIIFTSGGTEADNMAINCAVVDMGARRIITSKIEHHAVLHTVDNLVEKGLASVDYLKIDERGRIDLEHLDELLKKDISTIVSLMHSNNELGSMIDLEVVGNLCKKYGALFHSDTVQTMGYFPIDASSLPIDFMVGSAHKLNGPKGVGFLYKRKGLNLSPLIRGGNQENSLRPGTENIYGIIGMAKALEVSCAEMEKKKEHILSLKKKMIQKLSAELPGVFFNGDPKEETGSSHYVVLNVSIPNTEVKDMMLLSLDLHGICVSGGSACSSGSDKGSHVLTAIGASTDLPAVRFSFGKYNTLEEVDYTVEKLKQIIAI